MIQDLPDLRQAHAFALLCCNLRDGLLSGYWSLIFRFELRLQSVVISQLLYLHFIRMYNLSFKSHVASAFKAR
jgi:hypothetical protein